MQHSHGAEYLRLRRKRTRRDARPRDSRELRSRVGLTAGNIRAEIDQNSVFGFAELIGVGMINALASIRQPAR